MHNKCYVAIFFIYWMSQVSKLNGYPIINIRRLLDASVESRYKKSDIIIPQLEDDVVELENLKQYHDGEVDGDIQQQQHHQTQESTQEQNENNSPQVELGIDPINPSGILPELERQLESESGTLVPTVVIAKPTNNTVVVTGQPEHEPAEVMSGQGGHRPPILPHKDGGKTPHNSQQQLETPVNAEGSAGLPSMAKTAESLLSHKNGQYSSFDMAQYVFWTGDEVGVARAVEEFIEQGLMSRENALKFLREIRLGIEYLQRSYADRVFPEEIRENNIKKNSPQYTTSSTPTTTTTTEKPFPSVHANDALGGYHNTLPSEKTMDSVAIWNRLQELNNENRQELGDYDEAAGRAKITEFLYNEYTLEEILYNLAKVMFTQSLAQGSGAAQYELQKLTDFLEREGNRGIIPLDLQKKVLHVLLTALSDTLIEHPELLPAAHSNLGISVNSIPLSSYATYN